MVPRNVNFPSDQLQRPRLSNRLFSAQSIKTFKSHSSSFEADDERSSSTDSMGPDPALIRRGGPQYEGEDTRLTSRKELWGWYAYGFAAEVFVICGVGSFIPITLEQLSRENGVLLSDHTTPCVPPADSRSPLALAARILTAMVNKDKKAGQCVIYFLGMEINTASFALYAFSVSVLLQALVVISISCAADHGSYRKRLLLGFAAVGSISTMLFIVVLPQVYLLGAVLAIISNVCFGASFVLLNSFLPLLVRHHPTTQHLEEDVDEDAQVIRHPSDPHVLAQALDSANDSSPLLPSSLQEKSTSVEMKVSTTISATGIGIGYSAGLFVQCLSILIILSLHSTTFSLRLVLFIIGVWWFLFTIPSALWLRPRPGPPLPLSADTGRPRTWAAYIGHSWTSLYRTLQHALQLKDISLFLLSWFLLSDAIATVSSTAILFAKTQLHMSPPYLALISLVSTTAGIAGAFSWSALSRYFHLKPTHTILACLFLFEMIPLYGLLAYIPAVQRLGYFGLQHPAEMYPLGLIYGFVLGGLSSYCRALFGELIPPGNEAAFYALYAITDKGSSVFGPAVVGAIIDKTGEIRAAFWFLAVLVGAPAPIIYWVNVQRGREDGAKMAEIIEGFRSVSIVDDDDHDVRDIDRASGSGSGSGTDRVLLE